METSASARQCGIQKRSDLLLKMADMFQQPSSQFARWQARLMFLKCVGQDIVFKVRTSLSTNKCQLSQGSFPIPSLAIISALHRGCITVLAMLTQIKTSHLQRLCSAPSPTRANVIALCSCAASLSCAL